MTKNKIRIIGAGLAGSEAAWQAANLGARVELWEMRPTVMTKAHKTADCAELVCSNSFRGVARQNAVGLLKEELRLLNSLIMRAADASQVPAGGALAVDRSAFSTFVTEAIQGHPDIDLRTAEICSIEGFSKEEPLIVASGPLTSIKLAEQLSKFTGSGHFAFYDAISPIVLGESIDHTQIFRQSRYDKGGDDYLNIPLSREEYYAFIEAVAAGEKHSGNTLVEEESLDQALKPFEGCMPIEDMIERGPETLLFGPLKPVGLRDPRTGKQPFAVIQLRQDDKHSRLWSMVGFQTRLKHNAQTRIFKTLPGLDRADFVRLGSVHRNSFINSPECLSPTLEFRQFPGLFAAGQLTGVEGYVESTASGIVAGINAARRLFGEEPLAFPPDTAIGALPAYISEPGRKDFQPMNISYGLISAYFTLPTQTANKRRMGKRERRELCALNALTLLRTYVEDQSIMPIQEPACEIHAPAS